MTDDSRRDEMARIIYDAFPFDNKGAEKPPWIPNGNSIRQDDARRAADAILALPATNPGAEMFEAAQERIRVKADRRSNPGAETMVALAQAFVDRKYVARADARQKEMGLAYIEAERQDLAREIVRFVESVHSAPALAEVRELRSVENEIARKIDQLDEYIAQHCQGDSPAMVHARTIAEGRKLQANMDLILVSRALSQPPKGK